MSRAGVKYAECTFEMVAVGPIYHEQSDFDAHVPFRNKMAALERAVADELRRRGYEVLGTHPRQGSPDPAVLQQVWALLGPKFPPVAKPSQALHLTGGA